MMKQCKIMETEKATELTLNNPLIDDYSLKGAKADINITIVENLKLLNQMK